MSYSLIIAGSRNVDDVADLDINDALRIARWGWPVAVLCGMARGPDLAGKRWAEARAIPVWPFPADWDRHGNKAGILRNDEMGRRGDRLLAFYDGKSDGTWNMISTMRRLSKPWIVIHRLTNS